MRRERRCPWIPYLQNSSQGVRVLLAQKRPVNMRIARSLGAKSIAPGIASGKQSWLGAYR